MLQAACCQTSTALTKCNLSIKCERLSARMMNHHHPNHQQHHKHHKTEEEPSSALPPPTSEAARPESTNDFLTTPPSSDAASAFAVPECFEGALHEPPTRTDVPNPFVAGETLTLHQQGQGLANAPLGKVAKAMGLRARKLNML